ncbi:MAG: hypothetical protein ABI988_06845, partial [Nitrospirota bacterium]
ALDAMAWTLHTRPRQSLAFRGPAEWFTPDACEFRQHHAALVALGTGTRLLHRVFRETRTCFLPLKSVSSPEIRMSVPS